MILSEERISSLTHLILDNLIEKKWAKLLENEPKVLKEIRKAISAELKITEEIDQLARKKILSYKRPPAEGSPEWEVLYKKFFQEEQSKKSR